jgi:hypothetical protein
LKVLNEEKKIIDEQKDAVLLAELQVASETVAKKSFKFNLTANEWGDKTIYTIEDSIGTFYAMKQLQYNLRKTFKVSQANRFMIVKQLQIQLQDNFPKFIVRTDIKSFYESIPQKRLIEKINENTLLNRKSKKLISSLLFEYNQLKKESGIVENSGDERGIPRGVGISAYLAEFYMKDIDNEIKDLAFVSYYARYVDDIVVVFTPNRKDSFPDFKEMIKTIIETDKYGLKINEKESKTKPIDLINFSTNNLDFQFLGYKYTFQNKKFKEVRLSDNKMSKIKLRTYLSFSMFLKNEIVQRSLAKWLLIHQISFLTGNTRLLHNKNNILIGIYYSHSLLSVYSEDLVKLDRFLKACIAKYISDPKLIERLSTYNFQEGFRTKRFSKFRKNRIPDFRSNTQKSKRMEARRSAGRATGSRRARRPAGSCRRRPRRW